MMITLRRCGDRCIRIARAVITVRICSSYKRIYESSRFVGEGSLRKWLLLGIPCFVILVAVVLYSFVLRRLPAYGALSGAERFELLSIDPNREPQGNFHGRTILGQTVV